MQVRSSNLAEVLLIRPNVFNDERGYFFEAFNQAAFTKLTGFARPFVQDNQSLSQQAVLRGLHYQIQQPQGKLVRVLTGEVWDVTVDLRRSSPDFGRWAGFYLSAETREMAWIPPGFAHGFLVTAGPATLLYKATAYYAPEYERTVRWDDAQLAIRWPIEQPPILSAKDLQGVPLSKADVFE
jgi:dTDP-4-dehydrorhamnose 3,5-epimerase